MHLHVDRRTVRLGAAALAGLMAGIYALIGLGVARVVAAADDPGFLAVFGAMAASAFAAWAVVLVATDRRWLWGIATLFQLFVYWGYFAVAPDRTPAFEPWGIALRVIQLPLVLALVYLTFSAPRTLVHASRRGGQRA